MSDQLTGRRFIAMPEVRQKVGMAKSTIYAKVKAREFPQPVMLGTSARWVESEIDQWMEDRISARESRDKAA